MGVDRSKIEVITNGVDLALFETIGRDQRLARDLGLEGKFVAAYFGTHGMAHGLQTVLEAAELTRQNDQIRYLLVGNGADRERLLALKNEKELDNLIMLPRQDRAKMPALWSLCDVGLVLLKKSDVFRTVVPSKIFEAMAMRKPMILGVEGECQELLARYDCALPIEPEDAPALADAVLHLAGQDWQATVEMGARGRKAVAQHFDRSVLAERYLALLARLVGDPDPESANAGEAVVQLDRRPDSPDVGEASYQSERVSRERRA
jgi:glycosyltransferase involved in cell wall biosynthesis